MDGLAALEMASFGQPGKPGDPVLTKYPLGFADKLADDPDAHRWRAQWDCDWEGTVTGIALIAYPVMRKTPTGAWIDPYAYAHGSWVASDDKSRWRWVSDNGNAAWAKPTQERAISSIAVRLSRWALKLRNEVFKAREAASALEKLFPNLSNFSDGSRASLDVGR